VTGIDFKRLGRWQIDAIGLAVCVLLTLLVYLGAIRPIRQRYGAVQARRAELDAKSQQARKLAQQHAAIERRLKAVADQLARGPLQPVPSTRVNQRIAQVTDLACRCGLKVDEVRPGKTQSLPHFDAVPIRLSGMGSYANCVQLLHLLRRSFPDKVVTHLELSGSPAGRERQARLRVDLVWYAAPALRSAMR
jgi:Tfp pilus assembly protein PilO